MVGARRAGTHRGGADRMILGGRAAMRRRFATLIAFASLTLLAGAVRLGATTAELPDLKGQWKLLVLPFGEDEFAIVSIKDEGGKLSAEAVDTQAQIPGIDKGAKVERDG